MILQQCKLVLRVIRGSANDKMLNEQLSLYKQNPPAFTLMTGQIVKNVGDGSGNMVHDTYILSGGVFEFETDVKDNSDGDTEQAVAILFLSCLSSKMRRSPLSPKKVKKRMNARHPPGIIYIFF